MSLFKQWGHFSKVELAWILPSLTQPHLRMKQLPHVLEGLQHLDLAVINSESIPICRLKHAKRCKFPQASF